MHNVLERSVFGNLYKLYALKSLLVFLLFLLSINAFSQPPNFKKVVEKMKMDSFSFEEYLMMGIIYSMEKKQMITKGSYSDYYIDYYNGMCPFARFIKIEKLNKVYAANDSLIEKNVVWIDSLDNKRSFFDYKYLMEINNFYGNKNYQQKVFDKIVSDFSNYNYGNIEIDKQDLKKYFDDYLKHHYIQIQIN